MNLSETCTIMITVNLRLGDKPQYLSWGFLRPISAGTGLIWAPPACSGWYSQPSWRGRRGGESSPERGCFLEYVSVMDQARKSLHSVPQGAIWCDVLNPEMNLPQSFLSWSIFRFFKVKAVINDSWQAKLSFCCILQTKWCILSFYQSK